MAGSAKNAWSGPTVDAVRLGGFCRLKFGDVWMQPQGNEKKVVLLARMVPTDEQTSSIQQTAVEDARHMDETIGLNAMVSFEVHVQTAESEGVRGGTTWYCKAWYEKQTWQPEELRIALLYIK